MRTAIRCASGPLAYLLGLLVLVGSCTATDSSAPGTCRTVANCGEDTAPVCDAQTLACRACNPSNPSDDIACKNRKPETPRCGPQGACVACVVHADCAGQDLRKPACVNNSCTACRQSSDCASRVCSADGSCAPTTEVLFVNNKNGSCQAGAHKGTQEDPFCLIQDAVDVASASGKTLISIEPSTRAYEAVRINQATSAQGLYLIGAGSSGSLVRIEGVNTEPALSVSALGGKKVVLSVRGVELVGTRQTSAVVCESGAELTLVGSSIHDAGLDGITASGCSVTLDALRIFRNGRNGLSLTGSTYTVASSMIWANYVAGIALGSGNTGSLKFLTVYANGNPAGDRPAGIDCGAGQASVENSIVFANISRVAGSAYTDVQLNGCLLSQVVTNDTKATGAILKQAIEFVADSGPDPSVFNLRLKKGSDINQDCCVNKLSNLGGVDHDIDFQPRPERVGGLADIGAHEVQ